MRAAHADPRSKGTRADLVAPDRPLDVCWHGAGSMQERPGGALFARLEEVLPVRFLADGRPAPAFSAPDHEADAPVLTLRVAPVDSAPFTLTLPVHAREAPLAPLAVTFAADPHVPWPFRGRTVETHVPVGAALRGLRPAERVLAWGDGLPLLSMELGPEGSAYRSALALPDLPEDGALHEVFNGTRFLELLPLLHLLQRVQGAAAWRPAPLRAAFIVDDPNLHWPRYGCVDYRRFAAHAQRHHYHVAFATIPLDAWYTHGATAALFRRHPELLSLVVHGNDHTSDELARPRPRAARRALLQQALRRIGRLESRAGLEVGRVMVAPHGACSSDMLAELPSCGFESACISTGSLRAHNRSEAWTRSAGLLPSEHVHGCPVLPRWGLAAGVPNALLLAAYLGQALILCGHHRDCRDDLERFAEAAGFINGLGEVRWADLPTLSRLNYQWRRDGATLQLRPFGTRVAVELPRDAQGIAVAVHPRAGGGAWTWHDASGPVHSGGMAARHAVLERSMQPVPDADEALDVPALRARFVLRRLLTETRDRLAVL